MKGLESKLKARCVLLDHPVVCSHLPAVLTWCVCTNIYRMKYWQSCCNAHTHQYLCWELACAHAIWFCSTKEKLWVTLLYLWLLWHSDTLLTDTGTQPSECVWRSYCEPAASTQGKLGRLKDVSQISTPDLKCFQICLLFLHFPKSAWRFYIWFWCSILEWGLWSSTS